MQFLSYPLIRLSIQVRYRVPNKIHLLHMMELCLHKGQSSSRTEIVLPTCLALYRHYVEFMEPLHTLDFI